MNTDSSSRRLIGQNMRTKYEAGATVRELAEKTGLSHGTVINRLREAETPMRSPCESRWMRTGKHQEVARKALAGVLRLRYEDGASVGELAAEYERSERSIRRLLREARTEMRLAHESRRLRDAASRRALMAEVLAKRERGITTQELATRYGCSVRTIHRWLSKTRAAQQQRGPDPPPNAEVRGNTINANQDRRRNQ